MPKLSQKGFAVNLLLIALLVLGAGVGVYLTKQQTQLNSEAARAEQIYFVNDRGQKINTTESTTVLVKLRSFYGSGCVLAEDPDFTVNKVDVQRNASRTTPYTFSTNTPGTKLVYGKCQRRDSEREEDGSEAGNSREKKLYPFPATITLVSPASQPPVSPSPTPPPPSFSPSLPPSSPTPSPSGSTQVQQVVADIKGNYLPNGPLGPDFNFCLENSYYPFKFTGRAFGSFGTASFSRNSVTSNGFTYYLRLNVNDLPAASIWYLWLSPELSSTSDCFNGYHKIPIADNNEVTAHPIDLQNNNAIHQTFSFSIPSEYLTHRYRIKLFAYPRTSSGINEAGNDIRLMSDFFDLSATAL